MLTRAAAAQERLRKSELKAPRRSRRIRETMEARATNVQGASKTGKRTSTSKESESRRKEPPAIVTSRITKTAKARSKRAKKVDASRVLRAVEEHSERLHDAGRQFTPENDLTNPNLSTAPGHNGPELIDEDMADAERAIEEPTSADLPGSASPQNESVNASPSRHSHNDPVYSTRPRKSPSPKDDLVGTRTRNRYDDRVSAGRTAEQNRPRVSSEDAASLHEDGAKAADPERSSPLDNRDDDLGDMFSEERMSSEESDVTARYDRWRSREQPRQYYHGRPYQVGDRWRHRPGMDNDSQDSFSQEGEGEYPDPYHRSPRPARDRFFRKRFPQALFGVVIAQRALRRKRIQLQDCRHQTEEARFMVEMYQKGTTFVPTSEHEWRIDQAIRENLAEWKTHVSLRQGIESEIKFQIQHLEHRAAREIARLERASSPDRGDQQLHYLSENHDFWKTFDECEATADTLADIDFGLNQNERERDAIDDAIDRDYGPSPDFGEGVPRLSSTVWERDQNRLLASIPYLLRRYEELQLEKKTAEALREEQWSRLANLAEDALVGAKALEVLIFEEEQEYQRQECEVPKHTKKATTQEAAPLEPAPEQAEAPQPSNADQDLRQSLLVAKEAYRKAREDFEGARDLTRAEIAKLPQPVTEDDLGAATFQKLGRLTRVLAETENEFLDLKKRVQRAGLARPAEQTSDFSDQPDDEISETLLKEVADQSRERILKMQHWNGLDMESARSMSPDIPRPAAKTLMALPDVRVGEDSFECTEATGRTRERIDIMQALSRNIREQGDVPMADADSIIYDPEDEEL